MSADRRSHSHLLYRLQRLLTLLRCAPRLPDSNSKPKVECSVVTEFTDHICVTMDAELIMFLHDLVSAYLKEKEKGLCRRSGGSAGGGESRASFFRASTRSLDAGRIPIGFFLSVPKETNRRCSLTSSIKAAPHRLNGERMEAAGQGEG